MLPFDWSAAKFILDLVALGIAGLAWAYAWNARRHAATQKQLEAKADRGAVDDLVRRVVDAEKQLAAMPSKEALHGVEVALAEIKGELKGFGAELTGISRTVANVQAIVDRHNQHFLDQAGR